MSKYTKLLTQILIGQSDSDISFSDLCHTLDKMGFIMRVHGSHHIFRKEGVTEKINLQKDGSKAKPYQVAQVRNVILKYKLGGSENV